MDKFVAKLEFIDGKIKEIKTDIRPKKINYGVLKVGKQLFNLVNVERYFVNGKLNFE
ncbi:hypothetical protein [Psychrobacillus glaciei]|uniref:hypothetical protein n=1 Tax=Psychrobacillus glaciei TaxID=2283160 RepID=UPI00178C48A6|nr:hypothetical protein [Psychrobacillus glaciei]